MVQSADLLFFTSRNKELSYDQRTNLGEDIVPSEHSFEKVLKNYQKNNELSQDAIAQNNQGKKEKEEIIIFNNSSIQPKIQKKDYDDTDIAISDKALKKFPVEWLLSLLIGQLGDGSISDNSYNETLKIMAPSLQKVMGQKSMSLAAEVTEELKKILESLYLSQVKTDVEAAEININKESNFIGNATSTQYTNARDSQYLDLDIIENILLGKELSYNSSTKQVLDEISQYIKAEPKQIMSSMQTAGLGKKALISFIEGNPVNEGMNIIDEKNGLDGLLKIQNSDLELLNEVKDGIKIIQSSGENGILDYNPSENEFLRSEISDMVLVEPINITSGTEILDITKILDKNNPTASMEIIRELAEKISMNLKNNRYEIELQVKPEHLGRLILKVTLEDGILAGKIYTTNQQTGDILQNNLNDLRNALEEQGYSFSQLDVNVGNERNAEQFQQPNRDKLNIGDTKSNINSVDDMDESIEKNSKMLKNYTGSTEIDYFA